MTPLDVARDNATKEEEEDTSQHGEASGKDKE